MFVADSNELRDGGGLGCGWMFSLITNTIISSGPIFCVSLENFSKYSNFLGQWPKVQQELGRETRVMSTFL